LEELARTASKLSTARKSVATKLQKGIVTALAELGIDHAEFAVRMSERFAKESTTIPVTIGSKTLDANTNGVDDIEFYLSTNAGEEPKPLARVASGGEISRVMLAI